MESRLPRSWVMPAAGLAFVCVIAVGAVRAPAEAIRQGAFSVGCRFSHASRDDPIVYPGEPGASHRHGFYGNRSTDADSTRGSLLGSSSTCAHEADLAATWFPAGIFRGRAIVAPNERT